MSATGHCVEVSDPAIPFLAGALNSELVGPALQSAMRRWQRSISDVTLHNIRLIRHKVGRRALIEYQVSFADASGAKSLTLVGKIRAKGVDKRTPAVMAELHGAGFDDESADGVSVPEVIGIAPELHMWLQRKVPGVPLSDWPAGANGVVVGRRVAEAVCKLHRVGLKASQRHTLDDELHILQERFERLASQRPTMRWGLDRVLAACFELTVPLRSRPTCCIHRDFYPAQIVADGDRLWLLDLDLFCEGDPALDVGNFLGHLTEQALRGEGEEDVLVEMGHALESRFVELAGNGSRAAVDAWQTLTLVRHVSISSQFPGREQFTEPLLALCERRLGLR